MKFNPELIKAAREALSGVKISPPAIGWMWCDRNFYLPKVSSGSAGRWTSYPYQRGILNWMITPSVKRLAVKKPARCGFTKMFCAAYCCLIVDRKRNICVWHPSESDSQDFVKTEITPLFSHVKALADEAKDEGKRAADTLSRKEYKNCVTYFRGSGSDADFRQITIDVAIVDEADGGRNGTKNTGSEIERAWGRTTTSRFRKLICGSTPRLKHFSPIEDEYNASEHKAARHLPCPRCNYLHTLEWERFKFTRSDDGKVTDAFFECPSCDHQYRYDAYYDMDNSGVWMTDTGMWYDEDHDVFVHTGTGEVEYELFSLGVTLWSAYSYETTWLDLAREWVNANNEKKLGDKQKLIVFINESLGRTYEEKDNRIEPGRFVGRVEKYDHQSIPADVEYLTAGVDVQAGIGARVEVEILGWSGKNEDCWSIGHFVIQGSLSQNFVCDNLTQLLFDHYRRVDGANLQIKGVLVDEGDGCNSVYDVRSYVYQFKKLRLAQGDRWRAFRTCKGVGNGPPVHSPKAFSTTPGLTPTSETKKVFCCAVNHIVIKDWLFRALTVNTEAGEGYIHFGNHCNEDYFKQLLSERKEVKRSGGQNVVKYIPLPNVRNEVLDCFVYARAAWLIVRRSLLNKT